MVKLYDVIHCSQVLLVSLEAVSGNLLCQLGALSAEQTRKATILQGHWPLKLLQRAQHAHAPVLAATCPPACMRDDARPVGVVLCLMNCMRAILAGPHANAAFLGLASALGVLVRLDAIIVRNSQLLPAFAAFRRYAALLLWLCLHDTGHLPPASTALIVPLRTIGSRSI